MKQKESIDSFREISMNSKGQVIYWDQEWEDLNKELNRSREEVLAKARELGLLEDNQTEKK